MTDRHSAAASAAVASSFREHLSPDERMSVSEWADRHRILNQKGAAEPGRWRTSRTPYLREIMDALSPDSPVQDVWFMKGSQVGATELGLNWTGFAIDCAPGPMLFVQPSLSDSKTIVRQRLDPLIDDTPRLAAKLPPRRSKEGGNSLFLKEFPGGMIRLTGANSASALASTPMRYLFLDEVDRFPGDVEGEGDPVDLANARTRTFARNRKRFYSSTPTIRGASRIEAGFLTTDQRHYFIPCPHCGEYQIIRWDRIRWDEHDMAAPAWLECAANGCVIEEREKPRFLEAGEWRGTVPENASPVRRGYHLSSLYSPLGWLSWTEVRDLFLKAKDSPEQLKTWVNTILGEAWVERGDAPPWARLYGRRESYPKGTIPMGGVILTAGADVQGDRIEVEVRAWGPRFESWSVDYIVLDGDTAILSGPASPWVKLSEVLTYRWRHASGAEIPIQRLAVDSGYRAPIVYTWARGQDQTRVSVVKGSERIPVIVGLPTKVDVHHGGKKLARGLKLWSVGTSVAKSELYAWLRQDPDPDHPPTGFVHFPSEYDQEYFQQLTAEQLVAKKTRTGHSKYEWEKMRRQNEALDCAVYNRAAAAIIGIDRYQAGHWGAVRKRLGITAALASKPKAPPPAPVAVEDQVAADATEVPPPPPPKPIPRKPAKKKAAKKSPRRGYWSGRR